MPDKNAAVDANADHGSGGQEPASAQSRYRAAEQQLGDSGNVKPQAENAGLDASRGPGPDDAARPGGAPSAPSLPAGDSQH